MKKKAKKQKLAMKAAKKALKAKKKKAKKAAAEAAAAAAKAKAEAEAAAKAAAAQAKAEAEARAREEAEAKAKAAAAESSSSSSSEFDSDEADKDDENDDSNEDAGPNLDKLTEDPAADEPTTLTTSPSVGDLVKVGQTSQSCKGKVGEIIEQLPDGRFRVRVEGEIFRLRPASLIKEQKVLESESEGGNDDSDDIAPAPVALKPTEPTEDPPLPTNWKKVYSKSKQRFYYFNTKTGASAWTT